jgi:hypothetical protein
MPEVRTADKKQLVAALVRSGWLRPSGSAYSETPSVNLETGMIPKDEHIRLWKKLNTLKVHGIIGYNRTKVWLV